MLILFNAVVILTLFVLFVHPGVTFRKRRKKVTKVEKSQMKVVRYGDENWIEDSEGNIITHI